METILLTATIDVNHCSNTKRISIEDRINDYYVTLKYLLEETDLDIIFVENSNYDLGILNDFANNTRIEILQFDGNVYERRIGKSFGECLCINYALIHSEKIKTVDYIMKLTGRYRIDYNLIRDHLNEEYIFFIKKRFNRTDWMFTGFFKIPISTWIKEFASIIIIDSDSNTIESVFYDKLKNRKIFYLADIGLKGISGTRNIDINQGLTFTYEPFKMRFGKYKSGLINLINSIDSSDLNMVEIGSYIGESTEMFLKSEKINHITCVDPWCDKNLLAHLIKYAPSCIIELYFDARMKNYDGQFTKMKSLSSDAVNQFDDASLDFVYIDGDHSYNFVKNDINSWIPKVKQGGWIGGHDYHHTFPGVIQSVKENFTDFQIFEDTSWLVQVKN